MAAKTSEWRPGPTVCRCCLTEGCYKDISTEYFWMGKREVYAEMLADTFDLSIAYSQSGGPNSNSRLICEPCISRLRDAADFKRQVAECEKTFLQHLDPSSSSAVFEVTTEEITSDLDKDVKLEQIKIEKLCSDDEFDAGPDFADVDDDDDLDDEPLTKLASRIPKTESMDATDLMDNATATLTLKRKATKTKSPAKKIKKKEPKATASKDKPEKKKKAECDPARWNASMLIRHTSVSPFRVNVKSVTCVYCGDAFEEPERFRHHMAKEHGTFRSNMAFAKLPKSEYVKVDISGMRCRICSQFHPTLQSMASHLKEDHGKDIRLDSPLGVMPYHLTKDNWVCAVCGKGMPSLLHLNKHTVSHFLSFVCEICGKSYAASSGLLTHVRSKHEREYNAYCKRCRVIFPSIQAKQIHQRTSKRCMPHCCTECPERFPTYKYKQRHMTEEHGVSAREYNCGHCQLKFGQRQAFYDHYKLCHSVDCLACTHCGCRFACASKLNRHLKKHAV